MTDGDRTAQQIHERQLPMSDMVEIEVCLGCGYDINKRDCGCPAGTAKRLVKRSDDVQAQAPEEPSVMGAGGGPHPMPSRSEAEAIWRRLCVDRMVERGIDRHDAQACCDAGDADLSVAPADAADDELQYWEAD